MPSSTTAQHPPPEQEAPTFEKRRKLNNNNNAAPPPSHHAGPSSARYHYDMYALHMRAAASGYPPPPGHHEDYPPHHGAAMSPHQQPPSMPYPRSAGTSPKHNPAAAGVVPPPAPHGYYPDPYYASRRPSDMASPYDYPPPPRMAYADPHHHPHHAHAPPPHPAMHHAHPADMAYAARHHGHPHHHPALPSPHRGGSSGAPPTPSSTGQLTPRFFASQPFEYDRPAAETIAASSGGGGSNKHNSSSTTNARHSKSSMMGPPPSESENDKQFSPTSVVTTLDTRSPEGSRNLNQFEERVPNNGAVASPRAPPPSAAGAAAAAGRYYYPPSSLHSPSHHGHPGHAHAHAYPYAHHHPHAPPPPHHRVGGGAYAPPHSHHHYHHPSQHAGEKKWACDYCNHKFTNWEDCSDHETVCRTTTSSSSSARHHNGGGVSSKNNSPRSSSGNKEGHLMENASYNESNNNNNNNMAIEGEYANNTDRETFLLSTPHDGESLSDRQCYVRTHFVELFIANQTDVLSRHSRGAQKLHVNQVGLRCAYCAVKLKPRDRAERAICYPSSISRIYQTVADMQRFHFEACVAIPPQVLRAYKTLKTTRPRGVGSPQSYWDKSARDIGLVDSEEGIQLCVEGSKLALTKSGDPSAMPTSSREEVAMATAPATIPELTNVTSLAVSSSEASASNSDAHSESSTEEHHHILSTPRSNIKSIDASEADASILLMLKKTPESPPKKMPQVNEITPV